MKLVFSSHSNAINAWYERVLKSDTPSYELNVRSGNIYARGQVLYSYGDHFPLVRYIPEHGVFLENCDRYSTSTSKHQSYTRRLRPHLFTSFSVPTPLVTLDPVKDHADFLQYFETRMRDALGEAKRSRKYKEYHNSRAATFLQEREAFCRTFLPDNHDIPALPVDVTAALVTMRLAA